MATKTFSFDPSPARDTFNWSQSDWYDYYSGAPTLRPTTSDDVAFNTNSLGVSGGQTQSILTANYVKIDTTLNRQIVNMFALANAAGTLGPVTAYIQSVNANILRLKGFSTSDNAYSVNVSCPIEIWGNGTWNVYNRSGHSTTIASLTSSSYSTQINNSTGNLYLQNLLNLSLFTPGFTLRTTNGGVITVTNSNIKMDLTLQEGNFVFQHYNCLGSGGLSLSSTLGNLINISGDLVKDTTTTLNLAGDVYLNGVFEINSGTATLTASSRFSGPGHVYIASSFNTSNYNLIYEGSSYIQLSGTNLLNSLSIRRGTFKIGSAGGAGLGLGLEGMSSGGSNYYTVSVENTTSNPLTATTTYLELGGNISFVESADLKFTAATNLTKNVSITGSTAAKKLTLAGAISGSYCDFTTNNMLLSLEGTTSSTNINQWSFNDSNIYIMADRNLGSFDDGLASQTIMISGSTLFINTTTTISNTRTFYVDGTIKINPISWSTPLTVTMEADFAGMNDTTLNSTHINSAFILKSDSNSFTGNFLILTPAVKVDSIRALGQDTKDSSVNIGGSGSLELRSSVANASILYQERSLNFSAGSGTLILTGNFIHKFTNINLQRNASILGNSSAPWLGWDGVSAWCGPTNINLSSYTLTLQCGTTSRNLYINAQITGTGGVTLGDTFSGSNIYVESLSSYTGITIIRNSAYLTSLSDVGVSSSIGAPASGNATIYLGSTSSACSGKLYLNGLTSYTNRPIQVAYGQTNVIGAVGLGTLNLTGGITTNTLYSVTVSLSGTTSTLYENKITTVGITENTQVLSLMKEGTCSWAIEASCSYSGSIQIKQGALILRSLSATGSKFSTNPVTISAGGSMVLDLTGDLSIGSRTITINGDGTSQFGGAIFLNQTNDSLLPSSITLGSNSSISTGDVGSLSLSGSISLSSYACNLFADGAVGSVITSGLISGTGSIRKGGSAKAYISGSVSNSYSGGTYVDEGTLVLNQSSTTLDLLRGTVYISAGATLQTMKSRRNGAAKVYGPVSISGGNIALGGS